MIGSNKKIRLFRNFTLQIQYFSKEQIINQTSRRDYKNDFSFPL